MDAWHHSWNGSQYYRDGADSPPAAGAEVPLLLGGHVKQNEHVSRHEDQGGFIQRLQVPPAPAVVTKGVAEMQKGRIFRHNNVSKSKLEKCGLV